MRINTTYVDRTKDNDMIYNTANARIAELTPPGAKLKQVQPYSKMYDERKIKLLFKIILAKEESPMKSVTFARETLKPTQVTDRAGAKRRVGHPRVK